MRILALSGSPRGAKSQTRRLAERVLEEAKGRGAEVELVDVGRADMEFCSACEACHRGPDCVLDDDVNVILERMLAADGVIFASPNYLNQVTAQMKALLDRSSHFIHCLRLTGKYTAAVTTSGGGGGADVQAFLENYSHTVGAQFVGGVHARAPLKDEDVAAAKRLGADLVAAIASKKVYPDQIKIIEAWKKHFGAIIAFRKDDWPYEYNYWREKGWL
jgi:multimeric flavodoxin WrbA